jgi:hypothetical protein
MNPITINQINGNNKPKNDIGQNTLGSIKGTK